MELSETPSVGTGLRALRAELGALQAGQAAELGQLQRALARAQAEGTAVAAVAEQEAAEVTRLRDEVSALRQELRRRQEREPDPGSASAREELVLPPVPQEPLEKEPWGLQLCPRTLPGGGQPQLCHHLCCHRCPKGRSPSIIPPPFDDSIDFADPNHEGTLGQDSTSSLKPFVLFIMASTIIFLIPFLKETWENLSTPTSP